MADEIPGTQLKNMRIDELSDYGSPQDNDYFAIRNMRLSKTQRINSNQLFTSKISGNFDWTSTAAGTGDYDTGHVVTYKGKWWRSEMDNNTFVPGTGSQWTEISKAPSGFVFYQPGVYVEDQCFVLKDMSIAQDFSDIRMFWLKNQTRPYVSTDFDAELLADDWNQLFVSQVGGISLGALFPGTFFASPVGVDATAVPGDFSKPYTLAGAVAAASPGESVRLLPGDYNITTNIAKYGVNYGSFGGGVRLWNTTPGLIAFDFHTLGAGPIDNITFGPFDYYLNGAGSSFFKFNNSSSILHTITLEWDKATLTTGSYFIAAPLSQVNSFFSGSVDQQAGFDGYVIQNPAPAVFMGGSGAKFDLRIRNASTTKESIHGLYRNGSFFINYEGINKGLTDTSNGLENCYLNAVLRQGATCYTYLSDNCSAVCIGGTIDIPTGSADLKCDATTINMSTSNRATITGYLSNCIFNMGSTTCDFDSATCQWNFNEHSFDIYGNHTGVSCGAGGSARISTVFNLFGEMFMAAGEYIEVRGKANIHGLLTGNVATAVLRSFFAPAGLFGAIKNTNAGGACMDVSLNATPITLDKAILESAGTYSIAFGAGVSGVNLKMYGRSYANKPMDPGGAIIAYTVGSSADFVVDSDVTTTT